MASAAWHVRRQRWVQEEERTGKPAHCAVCGSEDWDDLHHLTYDRMGHERHGDMVAMCRRHHEQVHRAYDAGRWRSLGYESVMRRLLRLAREEHERRGA